MRALIRAGADVNAISNDGHTPLDVAVLRDDKDAKRDGWLPTARGGAVVRWDCGLSLRTAAYLGWRMPTLNELFRPFRAGLDATAANPNLDPEKLAGGEVGTDYEHGAIRLSVTGFVNRLSLTALRDWALLVGQLAGVVVLGIVQALFYIAVGLEGRVLAHRSLSQRLWLVSERYRSLMAEIEDGMVDRPALLRRRDELISELHTAYDDRFSADQAGYENDRLATLASDRPPAVPSSNMASQH